MLSFKAKLNTRVNKNLYKWCINLFDQNNQKVGKDLIPFSFSQQFVGSNIQFHFSLEQGSWNKSKKIPFESFISAKLQPEDSQKYSMLGSESEINTYLINITKLDNKNDKEQIYVRGSHANPSDELDAKQEDHLRFIIKLNEENFSNILNSIEKKNSQSALFKS